MYNLEATISEAKNISTDGIPFDTNAFVSLDLDNSRFLTRVVKSNNPLFAESTVMQLVDPKKSALVVTLWNEGYRDKLLSKCTIPTSSLSYNNHTEEWYNLEYGDIDSYVSGSLRIGFEPNVKQKTTIISIIEGVNFPTRLKTPQDLFVKVAYGKVVLKTKAVRVPERAKAQFPILWNEKFTVDFEDSCAPLTVSLYRNSLGFPHFMGQIVFEPSMYTSENASDKWYVLKPTPEMVEREQDKASKKLKARGSIRLNLRLTKRKVYPLDYYNPLLDLLMDSSNGAFASVALLEKTTLDMDVRMDVATALVKIYEVKNQAPVILKLLISNEINNTVNCETLFRENSLASKAVDIYMKLSSFNYLQFCVKDTVYMILRDSSKGRSYEIEHEKPEDAKKNWRYAQRVLEAFLEKLYTSQSECPRHLSYIFEHIQMEVQKQFPKEANSKYAGVSGFLFLRFICPAILGPKLFDITRDHPSPKASNNLLHIARIIQRIANMSDTSTSCSDPYALEKEKFIESQKKPMKQFINAVSTPSNTSDLFNPLSVDLQHELSFMHDHLKTNYDMIHSQSKKSGEHTDIAKQVIGILETMKRSTSDPGVEGSPSLRKIRSSSNSKSRKSTEVTPEAKSKRRPSTSHASRDG